MPLSEIRDMVVEMTGRKDWETTTTTLDRLINRGQRYLDRIQPTHHSIQRVVGALLNKDSIIEVPYLRYVSEVFVHTGENGRRRLEKIPLDDMLGCYKSFVPQRFGANLVTNGTFTGNATGWTVGSFTYRSNQVYANAPGSPSPIYRSVSLEPGKTYRLRFEVPYIEAGTVTPTLGGTEGTAVSSQGIHVEEFEFDFVDTISDATVKFTPDSDFVGSLDNVVVQEIVDPGSMGTLSTGSPLYYAPNITTPGTSEQGGNYTDYGGLQGWQSNIVSNPFESRGIVVYPPADGTYPFEVVGGFYSKPLTTTTDESYWSEEHPEILSLAATYFYEQFFRNREGVQAVKRQLDDLLMSVDADLVHEEIVDITNMGE